MLRAALATLLFLQALLASGAAAAFGFDDVAEAARRDAALPYQAPSTALPRELATLSYDGQRDIRYRPERAIWREQGLPFELQLFHRGGRQPLLVQIHEIVAGQARELRYQPDAWDFGANRFDRPRLGRPGPRRLSRPLPAEQHGLQGRADRLPGRQLLPRLGQGPAVRAVGARAGHRYR